MNILLPFITTWILCDIGEYYVDRDNYLSILFLILAIIFGLIGGCCAIAFVLDIIKT